MAVLPNVQKELEEEYRKTLPAAKSRQLLTYRL